jgi:hypothetical protein
MRSLLGGCEWRPHRLPLLFTACSHPFRRTCSITSHTPSAGTLAEIRALVDAICVEDTDIQEREKTNEREEATTKSNDQQLHHRMERASLLHILSSLSGKAEVNMLEPDSPIRDLDILRLAALHRVMQRRGLQYLVDLRGDLLVLCHPAFFCV